MLFAVFATAAGDAGDTLRTPMELSTLRYFRAIADHGSVTKAARAVGLTQPALSAVLKKLEDEVGAELVQRTGRGVELTEAGRVFRSHADDTIRAADATIHAVRELVGLERGSIRVGGGATATTYLLPNVVSQVRKAHPGLRYYVREAGSRAVAEAVAAGELDLGIVTQPVPLGLREDLLVAPLVEDEMRLIVPRTSGWNGLASERVADRQPGTRSETVRLGSRAVRKVADNLRALDEPARGFRWRDLVGVPVVGFEAGSVVREVIDQAAAAAGVKLEYVMELRSIESIQSMVSVGIGVGFVSRFALGASEGLRCREGTLARELVIVQRRDRVLSPAAAEFERALVESVGRRARG